ncbi:hypothetical protein NP945_15920 [Mesorhizobium sp. LMG17149]|jgi:hypothetical protein|uniref:hypothetical protein n=1 Tax=Mesorhizobium sp. LMG17149 TaxID=2968497 RepID=UPI00211821C1|nr:hypothetical protein [Mesorhizobium sp. LMG17149]MCQ8873319.1 hypothetical protein [Mesorhizobium sp. LMG17149]
MIERGAKDKDAPFDEEAELQIMTNEKVWLAIIVLGPTATYFVYLWIVLLFSALR